MRLSLKKSGGAALLAALVTGSTACAGEPVHYDIGQSASAVDIARIDIDVRPDGKGLPSGAGRVGDGAEIYAEQCASCHGATGKEGPFNPLVGDFHDPMALADASDQTHTIGSYWPYATTVFDYVRRAMPIAAPGSLSDNEVYALTAWLLFQNGLIAEDAVMDAESLPKVEMPAKAYFYSGHDELKGGGK